MFPTAGDYLTVELETVWASTKSDLREIHVVKPIITKQVSRLDISEANQPTHL
jgi:hypothetical protein